MRMTKHGVACIAAASMTLLFSDALSAQSTVQLPSFSRFSYSGSVLVPVGGSTSLGGVSRSASGSTSRRFGGRARGAAWGHAGASAKVTVIDHDAIDRQLRGLPPRGSRTAIGKGGSRSAVQKSATAKSGDAKSRDTNKDPDAEGKALVRFARKQYLAGQKSSAFDAYQLAIETLSPRLSELAEAEFRRVFPSERRPIQFQPTRVAGR